MDVKNLAYKDYINGMKYKDIAEKYNVSINTVRSWKQRNGWERTKKDCAHDAQKNDAQKNKGGAPKGNKNAKGNKGGSAPYGNQNAKTHGFFSKYLPADALEIMQEIEQKKPIDILWEQITIQYTAIIRAQRLMYVKDQKDKTTEIIQDSDMGTMYEHQQAWDKHANFLSAQSRAMATLNSLIAQYEKMLHSADDEEERRERLNKMRLESARIEAETERIKADKGTGSGSVIFAGEGDLVD